jgi:RimJ/RimL family protein N-acetyltransferase
LEVITNLLRNGKAFIGIAGLLHQEIDGNVEAEISYRIKPEYWNCGFATEAAQACKDYAEKILYKNRLISIIHPANYASKCVAEKLGVKKTNISTFMDMKHEIYVY